MGVRPKQAEGEDAGLLKHGLLSRVACGSRARAAHNARLAAGAQGQ
jgi:hypothetical protein